MQSQTKTKSGYRGKSDPRMALVKWARENGAVHIKIDGIEVVFPPNYATEPQSTPMLSPEDIVRRAQGNADFDANAPDAVTPQHPDEFAQNSDRWGSWLPNTLRG